MRTTITLEPDVEALLKTAMRERDMTFKEAVNVAIREGLSRPRSNARFETPTFDMGVPFVDITKALQLAADLEDEEVIRKMALGT